jgi:proteasome assembly chaperone 4
MAQRLGAHSCIPLVISIYMSCLTARRFRKQIFLSVDIPPAFLSMEQGSRLFFEVEKGAVETLKELEQATTS